MKGWQHDIRGMSLVEVVIAVAVLAMIAGGMMTVAITTTRANWKARNNIEAQQNARIGLDKLTRDLRQAGKLFSNGTAYGGFIFTIACSGNPQISFVLPHVKSFTLSDNTTVWAPDIRATDGKVPYDGWYVSYYLAAVDGGTTLNASGPYLVRTTWDLTTSTLSSKTAVRNVSGLVFSDRVSSACPTAWVSQSQPGTRETVVTLTSSQRLGDGSVVSTTTMVQDVMLRNAWQ
jgi:type II secretory pathway pseudopilin PulG